ncbi:MAG: CDP-archaeol synthase [Firmicutes bacterium]|nr:CDP-archaeol synthase [Bacillota bacterium]
MKTRIISGTIGVVIFLFLILKGGALLAAAVGLLVALGTWELSRIAEAAGIRLYFPLLLVVNLLYVLTQALMLNGHAFAHGGLEGLFSVAILIFSFLLHLKQGISREVLLSILFHLFTLVYPGILFTYTLWLRAFPESYGWKLLLLAFLVIWGSDTGAYFIGSAWGKTPLAPQISPRKSVEGALGGVCTGVLAGVLCALFFKLPFFWTVGTSLLASIGGELGDLFESLLKRIAGVKDSGSFLPGHGGVLDRFDSAFFALPIVYYLAWLII